VIKFCIEPYVTVLGFVAPTPGRYTEIYLAKEFMYHRGKGMSFVPRCFRFTMAKNGAVRFSTGRLGATVQRPLALGEILSIEPTCLTYASGMPQAVPASLPQPKLNQNR
jgi:hypothetical protein